MDEREKVDEIMAEANQPQPITSDIKKQNKKLSFGKKMALWGGICFAGAMLLQYADIIAIEAVFYLPFDAVGALLRWMSLSGGVGNVAAWCLYCAICLLPIFCILWKWKRRSLRPQSTDILLAAASGYSFFLLYGFINPQFFVLLLSRGMGGIAGLEAVNTLSVEKLVFSGVLYSLLIGYLILKSVFLPEKANPYGRTKHFLSLCAALYVAFICFFESISFWAGFHSDGSADQLMALAKFALALIPAVFFITVIGSGMSLLTALERDKYSEASVQAAVLLAKTSRNTVCAGVLCGIAMNLLQVAFLSQTTSTDILVSIPLVPIFLSFAGLLIAALLRESLALYDDNQMII